MPSGTGLDALQNTIPERFHDVGIAEEHAVLLAAGMATQGLSPVCAIYSNFFYKERTIRSSMMFACKNFQ